MNLLEIVIYAALFSGFYVIFRKIVDNTYAFLREHVEKKWYDIGNVVLFVIILIAVLYVTFFK